MGVHGPPPTSYSEARGEHGEGGKATGQGGGGQSLPEDALFDTFLTFFTPWAATSSTYVAGVEGGGVSGVGPPPAPCSEAGGGRGYGGRRWEMGEGGGVLPPRPGGALGCRRGLVVPGAAHLLHLGSWWWWCGAAAVTASFTSCSKAPSAVGVGRACASTPRGDGGGGGKGGGGLGEKAAAKRVPLLLVAKAECREATAMREGRAPSHLI